MFFSRLFLTGALLCAVATVNAGNDNDLEGDIESLDSSAQTLTIDGQLIHTNADTDYDDDLTGFADLKVGERVEVDFKRDGDRLIAIEIEND